MAGQLVLVQPIGVRIPAPEHVNKKPEHIYIQAFFYKVKKWELQ